LSKRVDAAIGNVRVGQPVKKIIGGAVFLKDDNHVPNLLIWRRWRRDMASTAATGKKQGKSA
jgi:hypothetical protein